MSFNSNETVVLYFTRSADEEARAQTFCSSGNFAQNRAIAQKLINHTYKQIQASGLPVEIITSEAQQGSTFGEKLGHAFQALFDEGYENIIAVGNDCAKLSADTIKYTASLLQENSLVAGPAVDGGVYLLAINRNAFHEDAFTSLAWETDMLLDDLIRYASRQGNEWTRLAEAADIDNEEGLRHFIRQAHGSGLYRRLIVCLLSIISSFVYCYQKREVAFVSHHSRLCLFHRGPPVS